MTENRNKTARREQTQNHAGSWWGRLLRNRAEPDQTHCWGREDIQMWDVAYPGNNYPHNSHSDLVQPSH